MIPFYKECQLEHMSHVQNISISNIQREARAFLRVITITVKDGGRVWGGRKNFW